jgi:hypothetical protein
MPTTQPTINSVTIHRALAGAIVGLLYAIVTDLRGYNSAAAGAPFNWRLFITTIVSGTAAGALAGLGVNIALS